MLIFDLYCGRGGWAKGLIDSGHRIIGFDIMDFHREYPGTFVQCDLMEMEKKDFLKYGSRIDMIVASPPCTEFSKTDMPPSWKSVKAHPPNIEIAKELFDRVYEIVVELHPTYFLIENVRGARKFMPGCIGHKGSRYFWGNYPDFELFGSGDDIYGKTKLSPTPDRAIIRSMIPYSIARGLGEKLWEVEHGRSIY